jgi:serine protease Do
MQMNAASAFLVKTRLMMGGLLALCATLSVGFYGTLAAVTSNEILAVAQLRIIDPETKTTSDGSATFISADGYLLTNYHVIKPALEHAEHVPLLCLTLDARKPPTCISALLNVAAFHETTDLALLKVKSVPVQGVDGLMDFDEFLKGGEITVNHVRLDRTAKEENINLGEEVQILGYPLVGGRSITYTRGVVSGFERAENAGDFVPWLIKTDAKLNPGSSGGAAFNEQNDFVGVPVLVRGGLGNLGYIISLPVVNSFLDDTGLEILTTGVTKE